MAEKLCPYCTQPLTKYPDYFYCYSCSKQFEKKLFGKLKEVPSTLLEDQKQALGR